MKDSLRPILGLVIFIGIPILIMFYMDDRNEKKDADKDKFIQYVCTNIIPGNKDAENTCYGILSDTIDEVEYHNLLELDVSDGLRKGILNISK
jgi:hypothetical protein